jgi:hypothetical protein
MRRHLKAIHNQVSNLLFTISLDPLKEHKTPAPLTSHPSLGSSTSLSTVIMNALTNDDEASHVEHAKREKKKYLTKLFAGRAPLTKLMVSLEEEIASMQKPVDDLRERIQRL